MCGGYSPELIGRRDGDVSVVRANESLLGRRADWQYRLLRPARTLALPERKPSTAVK